MSSKPTSTGSYVPASQATDAKNDPFGAFSGQGGVDTALTDAGGGKIVTGKSPAGMGTFLAPGVAPSLAGSLGANNNSETGDELLRGLFQMSKGELQALQTRLAATGIFSGIKVDGVADAATVNAYTVLLRQTQLYQSANPNNPGAFTPDALLDSLIQAKAKDSTTTSTDTTKNLTNPVQARAALLTAFSDKLGRKPTDSETSAFTQALNSYESSNPSTTTTTSNVGTAADGSQTLKNQDTTSTDKGTGNLNFVNDFASSYATTDPSTQAEYRAVQHLNLYNAAIQAIQNSGVNTGLTD